MEKEGYTVQILHLKNATVRVFRPILSEEERQRRMNEITKAAVSLLKKGGI